MALNDLLASRLEDGLDRPPAGAPGRDAEGARFLSGFLRAEAGFLRDPGAAVAALESAPPLLALAGGLAGSPAPARGGYLSTHDGSTLFLLVSPRDNDDSLPALRRFVGAMRARAAAVLAQRAGFRVAFTGERARSDADRRHRLVLAGESLLPWLGLPIGQIGPPRTIEAGLKVGF